MEVLCIGIQSPHGFDKSKGFFQVAALEKQVDDVAYSIGQHSREAKEPVANDKRDSHDKFDHDVFFYVDSDVLRQKQFTQYATEDKDYKYG